MNNSSIDGLNEEERALAWLASWHPSFAGKAIVNPDFTFRAVNPQFCKIVGVTPAELINIQFSDITPEPVKTLDIENARLVKKGIITSYLLPKTYEFSSGKRVHVTLLVNGVYHHKTEEFLFYVSTILERKSESKLTAESNITPLGLFDWVDKKKVGWTIITSLGLGIAYFIEKLFSK